MIDKDMLSKILEGQNKEDIDDIMNFFNSDEAKEKIEKVDKMYKLTMDNAFNEIKTRAEAGDKESILMLKYSEIIRLMLESINYVSETGDLEADYTISAFDNVLQVLKAHCKEGNK